MRHQRADASYRSKQSTAVGTSTRTALSDYRQTVGQNIMRPDGNRAYLPASLWAAPIWLPENRADKRNRYPVSWTDRFGNKYEVSAAEELSPNPDMGVLLGLAALWQDHMFRQDVCFKDIGQQTYVEMQIPVSRVYKATGYTYRDKANLLNSIKRLSTITAQVVFAEGKEGPHGGVKFEHFFDAQYITPETNGQGGHIKFAVNRLFIPRQESCIWHPARLCQKLMSQTSRLIFWGIATSLHGWKGTAKDLYKLVYRIDSSDDSVSLAKIRKWKYRRLTPTLTELVQCGFKITQEENAYGEKTTGIYWPKAAHALKVGAHKTKDASLR